MTKQSLTQYDTVFCNSLAGLDFAHKDGLSKVARILTHAPAVFMAESSAVRSVGQAEHDEHRAAYAATLLGLSKSVFDTLTGHTETEHVALTVARQSIQFHRILFQLIDLEAGDFTEPRLFIEVETGNPSVDNLLSSPLLDIEGLNPAFQAIRYHVPVPMTVDAMRPPVADWLRLTSRYDLTYRFLRRWWRDRRPGENQRRAIVVSSNELVVETACHLVTKGYALLHQGPPVPSSEDLAIHPEISEKVISLIKDQIEDFLVEWVPDCAVSPCWDYFKEKITKAVALQSWAVQAWEKILDPKVYEGRTAVLTNFPGSPIMIGLSEYCRSRNIPLIGFQHGVTREICATHNQLAANFENGVSDLFLAFNDRAKQISDNSPFARGASLAVGIPAQYRALKRWRMQSTQPILYVSTCLYAGNVNLSNGHQSDIVRCSRELSIINEVLSVLPHRILYKTYPSRPRYADPDPVLQYLDGISNIDVFDSPVNLRNLIGKHRVIVTSRATSTLSVCAMSGRPLVFVDMPDHAPLRPELREEFAAAIFLFNYGNVDFLEKLRAFLSKPIRDIEAEWQVKAPAREQLIRRYFEGEGRGAGKRGAEAIHHLVMQSEQKA